MKENCIYKDLDFVNSTLPFFRTDEGECFAFCRLDMKECCYFATKDKMESHEIGDILNSINNITGDTLSVYARIKGVIEAIDMFKSSLILKTD